MAVVKLFSKNHIWVCPENQTASVGITERELKKLGEIMFLNLPEIGEKLQVGRRFGDIEGVKNIFELISPLDGEVVEINEKLFDEQEQTDIGRFNNWFIKAKYFRMDENLMDEETYLYCGEQT